MDLQPDRSTQEGGNAPFLLNDLRKESFSTVVSVSMETKFWRKMGKQRGDEEGDETRRAGAKSH